MTNPVAPYAGLGALDTIGKSEAGVTFKIVSLIDYQPIMVGEKGDIPLTLTLLGPDSKAFRQAQRDIDKRVSEYAAMTPPREYPEAERKLDLAVAVTKSWTGVIDVKSQQPIPCTPEAARAFYTALPAALDQALGRASMRGNFTVASVIE